MWNGTPSHRETDARHGYVESVNGRMRDELLNASLPVGLDHVRNAIAEWRQDFNIARLHSSIGYLTLAAFAEVLDATGSDAPLDKGYGSPPVPQPAPDGVTETAEFYSPLDEGLLAGHCS